MKTLKVILALTISALVLDAACLQKLSSYSVVEISTEESGDEDVTDDSEDDKENIGSRIHIYPVSQFIAHYTSYLQNHTYQVQETFSPPPEV